MGLLTDLDKRPPASSGGTAATAASGGHAHTAGTQLLAALRKIFNLTTAPYLPPPAPASPAVCPPAAGSAPDHA
jgi:hypothetical protein